VETQSASRAPESPGKIVGLETLALLETVVSSNWSVNTEDRKPTSPGRDELEEDSSGHRDDKANDQSFEDGVDVPVASQESVHSSAVVGKQKQTFAPVHGFPKKSSGSRSMSKRTRKLTSSYLFPTGSATLQATDLSPTQRKMKGRKAALGRVKLMSKSKNFLSGVGEIISSTLISDRLVRLQPVNVDPFYSKTSTGCTTVRSIVQYPQAQTDVEAKRSDIELLSSDVEPYPNDDKVSWSEERTESGIEIITSEDIAMAWEEQQKEDKDAQSHVTRTDINRDHEDTDKSKRSKKRDKTKKRNDKDGKGKSKEDSTKSRQPESREKAKRKRRKHSSRSLAATSSNHSDTIEYCTCQEAADDSPALCSGIAVEDDGEADGCRNITYDLREMAIELFKKGPRAVIKWLE
jgi:hypothetical protein